MKPTKAATETAAAAYRSLTIPQRAAAKLTARIAAGAALNDNEVQGLAKFFSEPLQTPEWAMAARLQGGTAMARQVIAHQSRSAPQIVQAAAGRRELDRIICDLDDLLWSFDVQARSEMRGAIDLGFRSALDRVGRMITSNTQGDTPMPAVNVAAMATAEALESINVASLIRPAVIDTCESVKRTINTWQTASASAIGSALFVEFDQEETEALTRSRDQAALVLDSQLTSQLQTRIGSASFERHLNNEIDYRILEVPQIIVANTAAVAGGATVTRDGDLLSATRNSNGLPTDGIHVGGDGIAQGPTSERLIRLALSTHRSVQAGARPSGIQISDALRADLADAATSSVVRGWIWVREALGPVEPGNEFEDHLIDGDRFTDEELEDLEARPQTPHQNCKCSLRLTRSADFAST